MASNSNDARTSAIATLRTRGFDVWARERYGDPLRVVIIAEIAILATSWIASLALGRSARLIVAVLVVAFVWVVPFMYAGRRLSFEHDAKISYELRQYRWSGGTDVQEHPSWWRQEPGLWGGLGRHFFRLIGLLGLFAWIPMLLGAADVLAVFWAVSFGALWLAKHERRQEFAAKVRTQFNDADAARVAVQRNLVRLEERLAQLRREESEIEHRLEQLRSAHGDPATMAALLDRIDTRTATEAEEGRRRERRSIVLAALGLMLAAVIAVISHWAHLT